MKSGIYDGLNIMSKLNLRRVLNYALIQGSFQWSRLSGKAIHAGRPFTLSIEPTTSCNLRCPECPSGLRQFSRPTGMLTLEMFRKITDQLSNNLIYLILYFQGEPFLNTHFFDLVEYAATKKIYTATSTNAHFLNDYNAERTINSGLDRLIISLDGTNQETYEKYRVGGSFEKVVQGIATINNWKKKLKSRKPFVILQFIVLKTNEHQLDEIKKLAMKLGVDRLELKTAQVYNYEDGHEIIPENEAYARYKKDTQGHYIIDNKLLNRCKRMWQGCVITWDGLVVPCCFDKDATHRMGDLKTHTFNNIWKSEVYKRFREKIFRDRKSIEICRNCTEK